MRGHVANQVSAAETPPRSPARQQLADAIAARASLVDTLSRIAAARREVGPRYGAGGRTEDIATALADARASEPRRFTAELMGETVEPSRIPELEAALADAERERDRIRLVHDELNRRERDAQRSLTPLRTRRSKPRSTR
jgi:hypothetical protein